MKKLIFAMWLSMSLASFAEAQAVSAQQDERNLSPLEKWHPISEGDDGSVTLLDTETVSQNGDIVSFQTVTKFDYVKETNYEILFLKANIDCKKSR